MRGKNCKALWIKALYKCSPFTIYHYEVLILCYENELDFFPCFPRILNELHFLKKAINDIDDKYDIV